MKGREHLMAAFVGADHVELKMVLDKYVVDDILPNDCQPAVVVASACYPTAFGIVLKAYEKKKRRGGLLAVAVT